jgi:phage baseplate assembly protein W
MAIKIKRLEKIAESYIDQQYVYKDLALDLSQTKIQAPGVKIPIPGTDIQASFDYAAIRNSLQNLFNTIPGQRFLFPEYGSDLYQYLFLPITESTGQVIGERILRSIEKFEPRVRVENINVVADPDNNTYYITLALNIPALQVPLTLEGQLNIKSQSFVFLPTSRTR